ncbi:MAG: prepilin peptidase [Hyphomicrobiaceae bacterium]|nr:MAG: prepilin peptidase [Hyphomicrobiaceae bacterium]
MLGRKHVADIVESAVWFAALYSAVLLSAAIIQPISRDALVWSGILALVLVLASAIDVRVFVLPNVLMLPLIVLGLSACMALAPTSLPWHVGATVAAYAFFEGINAAYRQIRGRTGLGGGDSKLFAASGSWLGLHALPTVLLLACATALAVVAWSGFRHGSVTVTKRIAFGPHLAIATWIVWVLALAG